MITLALLVAFLLEIFTIGAMSYAGFRLPVDIVWKFLFGLGFPVVVIIFWAVYMAPKSLLRLKNPMYMITKAIIFSITAVFLAIIGQQLIALLFVIVTILDEIVLAASSGGKSR